MSDEYPKSIRIFNAVAAEDLVEKYPRGATTTPIMAAYTEGGVHVELQDASAEQRLRDYATERGIELSNPKDQTPREFWKDVMTPENN